MDSPKIDSPQRIGEENNDWNMNKVDSIALLSQEAAQPTLLVEKAAKERDRRQAHADGEDRVPERIYCRLPGPVSQKMEFAAKYAQECQREQEE